MVILGIGNDLIAIVRIQQTYSRFGSRFLRRFLHPHEINEFGSRCRTEDKEGRGVVLDGHPPPPSSSSSPQDVLSNRAYEHLASLWAVKESVYKAFGGVDRSRLNFINIRITYSSKGRPEVEFEGTTKELAHELGVSRVHVAISHDQHYVIANTILEQ